MTPKKKFEETALITKTELEKLYRLGRALEGIVELSGLDDGSGSISSERVSALLEPIAKGLMEIYVAVNDADRHLSGNFAEIPLAKVGGAQ